MSKSVDPGFISAQDSVQSVIRALAQALFEPRLQSGFIKDPLATLQKLGARFDSESDLERSAVAQFVNDAACFNCRITSNKHSMAIKKIRAGESPGQAAWDALTGATGLDESKIKAILGTGSTGPEDVKRAVCGLCQHYCGGSC